jgi:S1-C subfamily serine protease
MRRTTGALLAATLACALPAGAALTEQERSNIEAHARVARSVVLILVWGTDVRSGLPVAVQVSGSGFAVKPGLIATNYHVVEPAYRIEVILQDGDEVGASIVGTAPTMDLALLRVPVDAGRLPPAPLGSALDLQVGQTVMTVSNPLGIWHSATSGIVSGLNRELPGFELGPSLIQFDAPLNRGQSGGPLVDSQGRVVGVTTAKLADADAMGLAIPIDLLTHILPDLEAMGHPFRPDMGLSGATVHPLLATLLDLPASNGVLVERVDPGSPADRAGLRAGHRHVTVGGREYVLQGDVVVAVNGQPVQGNQDLWLRFLAASPGDVLELTVVRADGTHVSRLTVPEMSH